MKYILCFIWYDLWDKAGKGASNPAGDAYKFEGASGVVQQQGRTKKGKQHKNRSNQTAYEYRRQPSNGDGGRVHRSAAATIPPQQAATAQQAAAQLAAASASATKTSSISTSTGNSNNSFHYCCFQFCARLGTFLVVCCSCCCARRASPPCRRAPLRARPALAT